MEKVVTRIEPTINPLTRLPQGCSRKRRVAAYARVSTDQEEQQTSYEAQVDYYTDYINRRPDWELVGIYTDEGISGTNTKRREGFKKSSRNTMSNAILKRRTSIRSIPKASFSSPSCPAWLKRNPGPFPRTSLGGRGRDSPTERFRCHTGLSWVTKRERMEK